MRLWILASVAATMPACAARQLAAPTAANILVRELPTLRQAEPVAGQPVFQLPAPGGPHRVGRMSFYALDASRGETFTADPADHRELVFHVWYPAADVSGPLASFIEVWPEDSVFRRSYSFMGVDLLPRVRASSMAEVSLSPSAPTYPVVLFSHGLGGISRLYTTFLENLASHGYIVVGVDHPYVSAAFRLPDGRTVRNLSRQADRQRDVIVQALDLTFMVDVLGQLQRAQPATRLAGRMDLNKLGVFGHSRGGFAAPHACRLDRRFKACANLDGYVLTPQVMDSGIAQPYMHVEEMAPWDPPPTDSELVVAGRTRAEANAESAREAAVREAMFAHMTGGAYLVVVEGAVHASFSDQPIIAPQRYPGVKQDFRRTLEITDAYLLAFFDKYLLSKASPLLEARKPPYAEVTLEIYHPGSPKQVLRAPPTY